MEAFVWTEKFDTGLPLVDAQHRHLVDVLNRVAEFVPHRILQVARYSLHDADFSRPNARAQRL